MPDATDPKPPVTLASPAAVERADDFLDGIPDSFIRQTLRDGKGRKDFALAAMNIPRDRYGAGSAAARATIYLMLRCGLEMAEAFVKDLEHHEDY